MRNFLILLFVSNICFAQQIFQAPYKVVNDQDVLSKLVKTFDEKHQKVLLNVQESILIDLSYLDKMDKFTKVNFATAYAKECVKMKLWAEVIEILDYVKKDISECVDSPCYYFNKGTAEFMLCQKQDALSSLRTLDDLPSYTARYNNLAKLMILDMETWNEQDIGFLSRKMREVSDRLGNGQGGKKTRKIQREILVRLDEMIKKAENDKKKSESDSQNQQREKDIAQAQKNAKDANEPAKDSNLPGGIGFGNAEIKSDKQIANDWGNLPEKERASVQQHLERRVAVKYRGVIKNYMQSIGNKSGN